MRLVFILGSHRTGTNTLASFFDQHYGNEVASFHQYAGLRKVNIDSTRYLYGKISEHNFRKTINRVIVEHINQQTKSTYILSNGFNYLAARFIEQEFNDVKIVHIVRDPRDFVQSYTNWVHGRWQSWVANKFVPFWNVSGNKIGEMTKQQWNSFNEFQRFCWYWKFKNEKIEDWYSADAESYFFIRFEDLINKEKRVDSLNGLLNFTGLKYQSGCETFFDTKHNASKGHTLPNWQKWDKKKCRQLNEICGNLIKKYSYGSEFEWLEKIDK